MAENKMLSFLPVIMFGIGATIKSFGIMSVNNINPGMAGYISIISMLILLVASYFIYLKY